MDEFIKWFGFFGTLIGLLFGILGTYFALNAWKESRQTKRFLEEEKERLNKKIKVILTDGKREHRLPVLRRQDVTRSEIQGRLGAIPMKQKSNRYAIEYMSSSDFHKQIDLVSEGTKDSGNSTLTISCTDKEFDQFDLEIPQIKIGDIASETKELKNGS